MFVKFEKNQKYCKQKLENQELCDTPDDFDDAGYVLTDSDLVVDIDDLSKEQIRALLDTFNIKTQIVWTDRGAHLYFKKPRTYVNRAKGVTPLGFPVEYKHNGNTYAITVKHKGVLREVENEGIKKPIPEYLLPLRGRAVKSLVGLTEGDGRNDALYAHKKKIARCGNVNKILNFINQHLFDMPLPEDEFQSVVREEAITAEKDGECLIADQVMKDYKVVIHKGSIFYLYDGFYINDQQLLKRVVYDYCMGQKTRYVDEVIKQIEYRGDVKSDYDEYVIKLNNGYLSQGEFYPYNYYDFTPYYIDLEYHEDAPQVAKVDEYLDQLSDNDEDYRKLILEVFASSLITSHIFKRHLAKFFIFVGDGGNGKGTLLQIIKQILGENNVSANSISQLADERYLNTLIGKLANLGDDIQDEPINKKQMKMLKNLSTGDTIQVRRLYENAISVQLSPTLIFTSNNILKSFDKDYSYKRRAIWCPMYSKPKVTEPDFIEQVTTPEALQYWLRLIVEAYQRLYQQKTYTMCSKIELFNEEYHKENNNTIEFVETLTDEDINYKKPPILYQEYKDWCEDNGLDPLAKKYLRAEIRKQKGYEVRNTRIKSLNNQQMKVYRKVRV